MENTKLIRKKKIKLVADKDKYEFLKELNPKLDSLRDVFKLNIR